jgi:hypothetical protein
MKICMRVLVMRVVGDLLMKKILFPRCRASYWAETTREQVV